jgi:hypothetical protein
MSRRDLLDAVAAEQRAVASSILRLQKAVCGHVAQGIVETCGLSAWPSPDLDGVWIELPAGADIVEVSRAIEREGAAARQATDAPYLLLRVQPWFDVEEIDQTILCCLKVIHVMLGIHPPGIDLEEHMLQEPICHLRPLDASR